jgi:hypothetical protein
MNVTQLSIFESGPVDVSDAKENNTFEPKPSGTYIAVCTKIEEVQKDWGWAAKVWMQIKEGPYAGQTLFDGNFIIQHRTSQQANDIGRSKLKQWCEAVGVPPNLRSWDPLIGKTVALRVSVQPKREHNGKEYGPSNRIEGFKAWDGMPAGTVIPQRPAPIPQQQQAPSTATAAVPQGNGAARMPWMKH